jgi:hypothetical protein
MIGQIEYLVQAAIEQQPSRALVWPDLRFKQGVVVVSMATQLTLIH